MKAIRVHQFGGPECLTLETVDSPVPGPGEVLVQIAAAGVNPVDTYIRAGTYARKPSLPYTPGSDGAGTVGSLGEGVTGLAVGDRVYVAGSLSGTYAEQALCRADQVHPLHASLSFAQGAALWVPYGTAYRALFQRGRVRAGQTLLVHGASGAVGLASVQMARAAGLIVIGTAGTEAGRRLVEDQQADCVLDHRDPDHWASIMNYTQGRGVDVVLEMLANENLGRDLEILAQGGTVVVIGSRGPVTIDARNTMSRDAAVLGMSLGNASTGDVREIHCALTSWIRAGMVRPVIARTLALGSAAEAHALVMAPGAQGKIVLETERGAGAVAGGTSLGEPLPIDS